MITTYKQENMAEKKQNIQSNGPRWSKAGTFNTFEEADAKRNKIAESKNMQTKVRRRHANNVFTVHYRILSKPTSKKGKKGKKRKQSKKS